jgi:hypothetical protein
MSACTQTVIFESELEMDLAIGVIASRLVELLICACRSATPRPQLAKAGLG